MNKSAIISNCKIYRYNLFRKWEEGPSVLFIMLNPSTADASQDDPTIRRCIGFAKKWGFGSLYIGNLYGYRSTNPKVINAMGLNDAIGPDNWHHVHQMISKASKIVVAWGTHGTKGTHQMNRTLNNMKVWCLGKTKNGYPKHPLYLSKNTELIEYLKD